MKIRIATALTWVAGVVLAAHAHGPLGQPRDAVARPLVIHNVTLVDGTGAPPKPDSIIVVRDGIIDWVGARSAATGPGSQAETIDAGRRFVLPGFIDLHQHAVGISAPARRWLAHSVTSVRDPGANLDTARRTRGMIEDGRILGPRLFLGLFLDLEAGQTRSSVRQRIVAESARGLDLVKLYMRTPPSHASAAIEEAHARGLPVTWHLSIPLSQALDLGTDGVEHLYVFRELMPEPAGEPPATTSAAFHLIYSRWARYLDPSAEAAQRLFRRLAHLGTVWTPTLVLAERIARRQSEYSRSWSEEEGRVALTGFDTACRMVAEAHSLGVAIGAGTDTEDPADLHRELALLVRCGLSPLAAVGSATQAAAKVLDRETMLGTLERGKYADMVIVDGDPTTDIRRTAQVWRVIKSGRVFDPDHLW